MKTSITTLLLLAVAMAASAKITVTKQTCNYQPLGMQEANAEGQTTGGVAVTRGDISVGWQLLSDTKGDKQTAYQVKVIDGATGRTAYDTGRRRSNSSQQIQLPALRPQALPYYWQVRVWDAKGKPSAWSEGQQIRVVPECVARGFAEGSRATAQWIGAITRTAAKQPEEQLSNGMFQKEEYKAAWADVDTLSARSIVMRKEFDNGGKAVADAVVYVSGMGHYELRINGQKVGDSEFAPLWSEYN